jgi:hypothetical protein
MRNNSKRNNMKDDTSEEKLSETNRLISKRDLLKFANQILEEVDYIENTNNNPDTGEFKLGVVTGVYRIVKLIERQ